METFHSGIAEKEHPEDNHIAFFQPTVLKVKTKL